MKCRIALCLVLIVAMIPMGCALADTLTIDLGKATPEELIAARMKIDATLLKASAEGALEKATRRAPALPGQVVVTQMRGFDLTGTYYTVKVAITLDKVYRGQEFMALVDGYLDELSSPDMEHVGVKFTVSYLETIDSGGIEDPEFSVDHSYNFLIYSGDGAQYDTWNRGIPGQKELRNIREGGTTKGFLYFEIPKDDEAPYLLFIDKAYPAAEAWFLMK